MLKEKLSMRKEDCVLIEADFGGAGVEAYALAFLKLFNNAREYPKTIYKVENLRDSDKVYVLCPKKAEERVKNFLTGIEHTWDKETKTLTSVGKVLSVMPAKVGFIEYDWDSTYHYDDPRSEDDYDSVPEYFIMDPDM